MVKKTNTIVAFVLNYTRFDLKREIATWFWTARYYLPVLLPLLVAVVAILVSIRPFPNQQTSLAIGQTGSMADQTGRQFAVYFRQQGLALDIQNTTGLEAGLQKLDSASSRVNAAFVTSGTASPDSYPDLVSLGSVQLAPLWLFYRGETIRTDDPFEFYRERPIAVGAEGTITNKLFARLMELNNPGTGARPNFLRLTHADAAQQLREGKIDAMFIVDGYTSTIVQSLLNDPSIKLMNFPLADAYVRKLPFLQKVVVPRASIDIDRIRPEADVALLASSVNLLVEKDLHPAVQWAFLLAAQDVNLKTENFFTSAATYPQYKDKTFPLSRVAERFYTSGKPTLLNYLPLWLAALIDNLWVVLLAIFLFALPFINKVFSLRSTISKKVLWKRFWELRYLEDELAQAGTKEQTQEVIRRLEELQAAVGSSWTATDDVRHYFNLSRSVATSIASAKKQLELQR